jgi:hypothetical protein
MSAVEAEPKTSNDANNGKNKRRRALIIIETPELLCASHA